MYKGKRNNWQITTVIAHLICEKRKNIPSHLHLITQAERENVDHSTVSRFINNYLRFFVTSQRCFSEMFRGFISDSIPYVIKASASLNVFCHNLIHLTTLDYSLHSVAEIKPRKTANW